MKIISNLILPRRIKKSLIRIIVWDFDGTLWRDPALGERIKNCYMDFIIEKSANSISADEFNSLTQNLGSWSKVASKLTNLSEDEVVDWVERKFDKTKYLKKDIKTVNLIEQLKDFRHLILTNSSGQQVSAGLKRIGFKKKQGLKYYPFEKIFSRDELDAIKPHPESFNKVRQYSKKPSYCHLMVGDSYEEDINPARKYGFQAVHIDNIGNYLKL